MPYIGHVEEASTILLDPVEIADMWRFTVCWKRESDGQLETAAEVGLCRFDDAKGKARLQRRLDDMVQRYAAYAERRSVRFELRQREKQARKLERMRTEENRCKRIRDAGPDLLAALKAMLEKAENADTLARAAIKKAEGANKA